MVPNTNLCVTLTLNMGVSIFMNFLSSFKKFGIVKYLDILIQTNLI